MQIFFVGWIRWNLVGIILKPMQIDFELFYILRILHRTVPSEQFKFAHWDFSTQEELSKHFDYIFQVHVEIHLGHWFYVTFYHILMMKPWLINLLLLYFLANVKVKDIFVTSQ